MTDKSWSGEFLGMAAGGLLGFAILSLIPGPQDLWHEISLSGGLVLFGMLLGRLVDK